MDANMALGEAQKSPERTPRAAQGSLKEGPSESQKATKSTSRPKMAQDRPREAQEAPRQAQEGSKMAQDGSKMGPGEPKRQPKRPKRSPRDGPDVKNGLRQVKQNNETFWLHNVSFLLGDL